MKSLLYAEDDQDDLLLFKEALAEINHPTFLTWVANGAELMELLNQPMELDILFVDVHMPRKDGLQCVKEIRANPRLKNMTIVAFSTTADRLTVNAMHEAGANLYILKPSDFRQWKVVIEKAILMNYQNYQPPVKITDFLIS